MILTGKAIRRAVGHGDIEIEPFSAEQINPASYDLTLGDEVAVYEAWTCARKDVMLSLSTVLDVKEEPKVRRFTIDDGGIVLHPGVGYLMHTRERVTTSKYVPVLDGKSSIGRLFVSIHQTAGFGDAGFNGNYTMEVTALHPIRLYAGMRIAQIRFHEVSGELTLYDGNYVGEAANGPVPSRAFRQFR